MNEQRQRMRFVLASQSPRRRMLLEEGGYVFQQIDPPFDDGQVELPNVPPHRCVEALAYLKAVLTADQLGGGVVLGCDTVVAVEGGALGKPRGSDHARAMLNLLMGREHEVISAVALVDAISGNQVIFHDVARVRIEPLASDVLDAYIQSGQWRGKAGGYNLAELEDEWQFHVEGDPTTVIGLPMQRLRPALDGFLSSLAASA